MIFAVEGPSAVGKSTLLRALRPGRVVEEEWEALGIPRGSGPTDPRGAAAQAFWADLHVRRWALLAAIERQHGRAYADTDPLKLYYSFAVTMVGAAPRAAHDAAFAAQEEAMETHRIGFVDHVLVLTASAETLHARKEADATRRRGQFALHLQIVPWIDRYYAILEELHPGTVHFLDAEDDPTEHISVLLANLSLSAHDRYDVATLRALKDRLDELLPG